MTFTHALTLSPKCTPSRTGQLVGSEIGGQARPGSSAMDASVTCGPAYAGKHYHNVRPVPRDPAGTGRGLNQTTMFEPDGIFPMVRRLPPLSRAATTSAPGLRARPRPHLHRDWARASHSCTGGPGTPLAASARALGSPLPTSAPGLGSPLPASAPGRRAPTSAPGLLGSPLPTSAPGLGQGTLTAAASASSSAARIAAA